MTDVYLVKYRCAHCNQVTEAHVSLRMLTDTLNSFQYHACKPWADPKFRGISRPESMEEIPREPPLHP